jgi:hypothetical protein
VSLMRTWKPFARATAYRTYKQRESKTMAESIAHSSEYYNECRRIAEECVKEAEGDQERAQDLTHEAVDGHQWIIYTYYNAQVLQHSRNDDAYFENFGPLEATGYSDAMAKMAYAAMHQDVMECLDDAIEAYNDAIEPYNDAKEADESEES